ncbi:hypothetical protein K474DRAFT_1661267 [Panus rudis PR-1116 ss-1]|nr:hypothetical protein K474DRAFT_1661267 [Panus rudis PR-1116 ss-1]
MLFARRTTCRVSLSARQFSATAQAAASSSTDYSPNKGIIEMLKQHRKIEEQSPDTNVYKLRNFDRGIRLISEMDQPITHAAQLTQLKHVGPGIIGRIAAYLSGVDIEDAEHVRKQIEERERALKLILTVPGLGAQHAKKLVAAGCKFIDDLKKEPYFSMLTNAAQANLHFAEHRTKTITREEMEQITEFIRDAVIDYDVYAVGPYRRGAAEVSHLEYIFSHAEALPSPDPTAQAVKNFKQTGNYDSVLHHNLLPTMQARGLHAADISLGSRKAELWIRVPQKVENGAWERLYVRQQAIEKREGEYRRLNLTLVHPDNLGAALIYNTGDASFTRHLRKHAISQELYLSEYGLWRFHPNEPMLPEELKNILEEPKLAVDKGTWELLPSHSEEVIFEELGMPYLPPDRRNYEFLSSNWKHIKKQGVRFDVSSAVIQRRAVRCRYDFDTDIPQLPPKKLGRPRKVVDEPSKAQHEESITRKQAHEGEGVPSSQERVERRGRPQKPVDQAATADGVDGVSQVAPRKRGRPRKPLDPTAAPQDAPRKRGRPRKPVDDAAEVEADQGTSRKPGRPRKLVEEAAEVHVDRDAPRKRGRPRKPVADALTVQDAPETRGRGRKSAHEAGEVQADHDPPRKRGRPRKIAPLVEGTSVPQEAVTETVRYVADTVFEVAELSEPTESSSLSTTTGPSLTTDATSSSVVFESFTSTSTGPVYTEPPAKTIEPVDWQGHVVQSVDREQAGSEPIVRVEEVVAKVEETLESPSTPSLFSATSTTPSSSNSEVPEPVVRSAITPEPVEAHTPSQVEQDLTRVEETADSSSTQELSNITATSKASSQIELSHPEQVESPTPVEEVLTRVDTQQTASTEQSSSHTEIPQSTITQRPTVQESAVVEETTIRTETVESTQHTKSVEEKPSNSTAENEREEKAEVSGVWGWAKRFSW